MFQPSSPELSTVDDLLGRNQYDAVFKALIQLRSKYPTSAELDYRAIKALALEVKWADSLAGDQRTEAMNKIVKRDFAGLLHKVSESYLTQFGPSDKHFEIVKALNAAATRVLDDNPREHRPMNQYNQQQFLALLKTTANLITGLKSFTFEDGDQATTAHHHQLDTTRSSEPHPEGSTDSQLRELESEVNRCTKFDDLAKQFHALDEGKRVILAASVVRVFRQQSGQTGRPNPARNMEDWVRILATRTDEQVYKEVHELFTKVLDLDAGLDGLPAAPLPPHDLGAACHVTWAQAAGKVEVTSALERLPDELSLGESFPEPIVYDQARKRLCYRGFMTRSSYDYLRSLSHNGEYLVALDELNRKSAEAAARPQRGRWSIALALAAVVLLVAAIACTVYFVLQSLK